MALRVQLKTTDDWLFLGGKDIARRPFESSGGSLKSLTKIYDEKVGKKEEVVESPSDRGLSLEFRDLAKKFYFRQVN